MHNPHYLVMSRHHVYYFRFPIPKHFHPHRKATRTKTNAPFRAAILKARAISSKEVPS